MNEIMMDKRLFVQCKRKNNGRSLLPEIKYPMSLNVHGSNIIKKLNDDINSNKDNINLRQKPMSQPPLSNILISKRITPCNPEQSPYQIRKKPHNPILFRKESVQKLVIQETPPASIEESTNNRTSTSLSHRIRKRNTQAKQMSIDEIKPPKPVKYDQYCFVMSKANNNEDLVREILLDRKVWRQAKWGECIPHLKWMFSKERHNYKKMWSFTQTRSINHFQFNEEISAKDNLIHNLQIYCETKKLQIFNLTPVTFILDFDDEYCEYNMKQFLAFFTKNDPRKNLNPAKKNGFVTYNFVNNFQSYMAWQNSDIKKKVNILSRPVNSSTYYSGGEDPSSYIWLLKPTGLNRGRGIQIFDSLEQLEAILLDYMGLMNRKQHKDKQKQKTREKPKQQQISELQHNDENEIKFCTEKFKLSTCAFVIQKYVERPLLVNNRKFDIRVWTLLTQNLSIYFFKEGYIRTSTESFSTDNISNYFIHLTNNSIQKNSENYGMFQSGNILAFKDLNKFIQQDDVDNIWEKMKEIAYMTFSSVKRKINPNARKNCFEIFGLDFIIDDQMKVWLIEVNENPSLDLSSQLLKEIIPRMLNDAFKLTIDQIFSEKKTQEKSYPVSGYEDAQNLWIHLGQLLPNAEYSPQKQQSTTKYA